MAIEEVFLQAAQVLGSTFAIAGVAFYFFDKKDQRSEKTITGIVDRHEEERKSWFSMQDRQIVKMAESQNKMSNSIDGLADAIRERGTPNKDRLMQRNNV